MHMQRTTIMLPPELRRKADLEAKKQGISLGELIRRRLQTMGEATESKARRFIDFPVWEDDGPADMAKNHDAYLYGP